MGKLLYNIRGQIHASLKQYFTFTFFNTPILVWISTKRLESDFKELLVLIEFQEMFKNNRELAGTFLKHVEEVLDFKDISVKKL